MSLRGPVKRALVVGGTSGIGQGVALALARRDYEVTVCGRSETRGQAVVASLQGTGHTFVPIDAFDLSNVKHVADTVAGAGPLDVVVMTQSMASLQGYTPTPKDQLDEKLQLHYFSRVYLTLQLLPHFQTASTPSAPPPVPRVLTVLSGGVHSKYPHAANDFELMEHYSVKNAADAAGFYNDAAFEKIALDHPNMVTCHAAPGFVNTNWGTELPWILRAVGRPLQALFGRSLEVSGEYLTEGLLALNRPGFYLMDRNGKVIDDPKAIKHTPQERDMIWEKTLKLLPDLVQS